MLSNALNKQERSELASGQVLQKLLRLLATSYAVHEYSYTTSMLPPALYTRTVMHIACYVLRCTLIQFDN